MRLTGLVLTLATLILCAPLARSAPAKITVTFQRGNGGKLAVTYRVPSGVDQLQLPARQASLRQKQWHIVNGAATINSRGIKLTAHAHPVQITVVAEAVTKAPDRVTPLVIPFSDGSVVVNVGAFVPANACKRTVLRFTPKRKGRVVLRGVVYTKPVTVAAACSGSHHGGYAYIGGANVERHKTFLMVIDPKVPTWIARGTREAMHKALRNYTERLGLQLPVRPTVYLSYSLGRQHARPWYHADVLGFGTVRLSYVGKAWLLPSSAASNMRDLKHTAAHETFHLWNGDVKAASAGPRDAWLKEGGAQVAALFTLKQAGWLTSADFLRRLNGDLQRCLLETGDRPWVAMKRHPVSGDSYYDCGATFNFMAAVLRNPAHPQQGFFNLWSQLLRVKTPTYSVDDFLEIAAQNARGSTASQSLRKAIAGSNGPLSSQIERLFTALGVPVRTVDKETPTGLPAASLLGPFIRPLLHAACKVRYHYGFWMRKDFIKVDVPAQCKSFLRAKRLVAISGSNLAESPLTAWQNAYAECQREGTVTFTTLHDGTLSLPCKKRVPKPPRLLTLEAYRSAPGHHTSAAIRAKAGSYPSVRSLTR